MSDQLLRQRRTHGQRPTAHKAEIKLYLKQTLVTVTDWAGAQKTMIITGIDTSDAAGKIARWFPSGIPKGHVISIANNTPQQFIDEVLRISRGSLISRLNIIDHGNQSALSIGNTIITSGNYHEYEAAFLQLNGRFSADGFVHLLHCEVGRALPLMTKLASTLGVNVYGGLGFTSALGLINPGGMHGVFPSGGGLCLPGPP
jgi:hypothetical protein